LGERRRYKLSFSKVVPQLYIKTNEELGRYKREKFNITIGDELPSGVLKLAKVYIAKKT
jgi:DNA-directed RNA polymerase subunit beta